jgi:hypothetical protein
MNADEEMPAASRPARLMLDDAAAPVTLVGFFYDGPPGVYTHHSSMVHVHTVRIGGRAAVYHVEAVRLAPGAVVRLPAAGVAGAGAGG